MTSFTGQLALALQLCYDPSFFTYQEENKKKQLKVKIQMAKFLQDTVEEMAVTAKEKKTQEVVADFANFFEKVQEKGHEKKIELYLLLYVE